MCDRKTLDWIHIVAVCVLSPLFAVPFTSPMCALGKVFQTTKLVNNTVIHINGSYFKMLEDGEEKDYPPVKTTAIIINFGVISALGLMMICSPLICCQRCVKKKAKQKGGYWYKVEWVLKSFILFQTILLAVCVFIKPFSAIIFVEIIGSDVGFTWSDLDPVFLVLFACDIFIAVCLLYAICMYTYMDRICSGKKTRLRKCQDCKMKTKGTENIFVTAHHIDLDQEVQWKADIDLQDIHVPDGIRNSTSLCKENIVTLVEQLWDQALVGIGRDAINIADSGIKIMNIQRLQNDKQLRLYNQRKKSIVEFANTVGGKLKSPEEYKEGVSVRPVATAAFVRQNRFLGVNVDSEINEVYLFHGTNYANLRSIEQHNFRRSTRGMLGCGIYFTDHPVKADQYATSDERNGKCCIIVSRVLLGDAVIQTKPIARQRSARWPPCKTCYNIDTDQLSDNAFDSVVYDGGLFREYVVYESCLAYPEFAIEYIRIVHL